MSFRFQLGVAFSSCWLALALAWPVFADDFTEVFTPPEAEDLIFDPGPGGIQLTFTPDGSSDFYDVCRTDIAVPPVFPIDVDAITLGDDDSLTVNLPMGTTIPFYGTNYSTFYINSNGNITFDSADNSSAGTAANHFARKRISGALTNLLPDPMQAGQPVGFIGWKNFADKVAIVFDQVPHFTLVNSLTNFQIEIFHSGPNAGDIRLTWHTEVTQQEAVAVGLSNGGGIPAGFTESDFSAYGFCATDDFGDLPDGAFSPSYPTLAASGGPSHTVVPGVSLGATVDLEADGQPDATAEGDDVTNNDEDGVAFSHPIHAGIPAEVVVTANVPGFLNGWIDFNGDGDFSDPGEHVTNDLAVQAGPNVVLIDPVPAAADGTPIVFSRWRFTDVDPGGELSWVGAAGAGEVEDYALGSISGLVWFDHGQGAGTYGNGLRDETNPEIAGMTVNLLDPADNPIMDQANNPVSTQTDSNGAYFFGGLPENGYKIEVVAPNGNAFTATGAGMDDTIDSDVGADGKTPILSVAAGQVLTNVDAGVLPPTVSFSTDASAHDEDAGALTLTVQISAPQPVPVTVPFSLSGAAIPGAPAGDFTLAPATPLTIPANSNGVDLTLAILDDPTDEPQETAVITLLQPTGADAVFGQFPVYTTTINDNDPPPVLSVNSFAVDESSGVAVFTISLSATSAFAVNFDYATMAGTAGAGANPGEGDFTTSSGTGATIAAGQMSITIQVPIVDDPSDENDETFTLQISNAVNATMQGGGGTTAGTATIADDDQPPSLSVADVTAPEDSGSATFVIRPSAVSGKNITFNAATSNQTAIAPADYTSTNLTGVSLPAGAASATVVVPIIDDNVYEADETFRLAISNATNASIADNQGIGTISSKPVIATGARHAWSAATGHIDLKPAGGGLVLCNSYFAGYVWDAAAGWIHFGNGTPADGKSYANDANEYGVNHDGAGNLTGNAWSPAVGWIVFEQTHGMPKLNLATGALSGHGWSASVGWIKFDGASFTIDDPPPQLTIGDVTVDESANRATFTVTKSNEPTVADIMFDYTTSDQTATAGNDYTAVSKTLTMPAAAGSATFTVNIANDSIDEIDETFLVALTGVKNAFLADGLAVGTITDNDDPPVISIANVNVDEGDGVASFTIQLSSASGRDIDVDFATAAGTAMQGAGPGQGDFTIFTGTANIAAGATTATIDVPIIDDGLDENSEAFTVTLTNPQHAAIHATQGVATGSISDDDDPPTLTIADASGVEASGAQLAFALNLDTPSGRDVTVSLTTSPGTATSGVDYTAANGVAVIIPEGTTSQTFPVSIVNDVLLEGVETLNLTAAANSTFQGTPSALGQIYDAPTILDSHKSPWSAAGGWQNWRATPNAGVIVTEAYLTGYAWSAAAGWIHLGDGTPANGLTYQNNSSTDYGVNLAATGELTGSAWSSATGWLTFEQTEGKPKIEFPSQTFTGRAWSASMGWIELGSLAAPLLKNGGFALVDSDGDGIDDTWELQKFGNLTTANAGSNQDSDLASDLEESIALTNPTDGSSFDRGSSVTQSGGDFTLTFPTNPLRRYSIEINPGLNAANWVDSGLGVFNPDAGSSTTKVVTIPGNPAQYFFRIRIHR